MNRIAAKYFRVSILTILLFIVPFGRLQAEGILREITLDGATKTTREAVWTFLHHWHGKPLTEANLAAIKSDLEKLNQFNVKDIRARDDTLMLTIEERWTIIPLPLYSKVNEYYRYGLVAAETNFLGRLEVFALGAARSSRGVNYIVYYDSPRFWNGSLGLRSFGFRSTDIEIEEQGESEPNRFISDTKGGSALLPWHVSRVVTLEPGIHYIHKVYEAEARRFGEPERTIPPGYQFIGPSSEVRVDMTTRKTYFDEGFTLSTAVYLEPRVLKDHEDKWAVHLDTEWNTMYLNQHLLRLYIFGRVNNAHDIGHQFEVGGTRGAMGYEHGSLWTNQIVTGGLQNEFHIYRGVTFIQIVEYVQFRHRDGYAEKSLSAGGGFRWYLESISLPVVGISLVRNTLHRSNVFNFFVGIEL